MEPDMLATNGRLSIARLTGSPHGNFVLIEAEDDVTGYRLVHITLTMQEFAEAVTGHADRPCRISRPKVATAAPEEGSTSPTHSPMGSLVEREAAAHTTERRPTMPRFQANANIEVYVTITADTEKEATDRFHAAMAALKSEHVTNESYNINYMGVEPLDG